MRVLLPNNFSLSNKANNQTKKQTSKQSNILTLTVLCEKKCCVIRNQNQNQNKQKKQQ